jgi:capsular exopolysaccharide synthesis family protein
MENDQRLTPLPVISNDLHPAHVDYSSGYTPLYDDSLDNKRSLRQYVEIVYKRLPIILAITIIVTAAVAFWSYGQPSIYQSSAVMIIEPRKPPQTQKDAININFGDDQKYYNTQLKLLQNPDLMKRVVVALGLQRDANVFNDQGRGIMAGIRSLFSRSQKNADADNSLPIVGDSDSSSASAEAQLTPEENRRAESYAGVLVGWLSVEQQPNTNIVNITIQGTNAVLTAKVADKVADLFKKESDERETQGATDALHDLEKSMEDLKGTIADNENQMIAEMKASGLPLQGKGDELRATDLEKLLGQYREAQNETGKAQAVYNAALAASNNGDILAVVGDNKAIQDARSQNLKNEEELEKRIVDIDNKINAAEEEKKKLLVKYTDEHKLVMEKTAQIEELNRQKNNIQRDVSAKIKQKGQELEEKAKREVLASLHSALTAAQQREDRQRAAWENAAGKANVEGVAETKLMDLKNQLESNRNLLNTYTQRQKEQELALASSVPNNIKVQSKAVAPSEPIGPQRKRNILVALFLSLGAGIGLAFLLDYLDDSVRTSDDISRHLGLPTLALIPHYLNTEKRKRLPTISNAGSQTALITLAERHSPMAEAYRHLRTSLLFSSAGKPPQTILVTSSQPSEGKTTTAINTAITLAQADADVVIVDCDLRRPRIHSHFGYENTQGLTNYLSGDKAPETLLRTYKELPRLKVITSGPIPPNPAELLSSNEMRNLLTYLSGRFKHVIIDSPPAISFTDASILATLVDGVVLVAMANKSSIHLMRQFKQRVGTIGARIYGVVLNGIKSGSTEYYYYGSGYYKYYSRYESTDESTPRMEETNSHADEVDEVEKV